MSLGATEPYPHQQHRSGPPVAPSPREALHRGLDACIDALMAEIEGRVREALEPVVAELALLRTGSEKPVTAQAAASEYGVSVRTVHRWIAQGKIRTAVAGSRRMVFLSSLGREDAAQAHIDTMVMMAAKK